MARHQLPIQQLRRDGDRGAQHEHRTVTQGRDAWQRGKHHVNPDAERNEPDNSIWYARDGYETENRAATGGDADFGRSGILKRKLHKSRNERERVNV